MTSYNIERQDQIVLIISMYEDKFYLSTHVSLQGCQFGVQPAKTPNLEFLHFVWPTKIESARQVFNSSSFQVTGHTKKAFNEL